MFTSYPRDVKTESMIVQKFGGSSVGTPEKIKKVAARISKIRASGEAVVVVVSAMGDTTDDLVKLADQVTKHEPQAYDREMDMLLSAGERISMALLSMALRDLNVEAISFTGSQAGIITDESHTRARILEIKPVRVHEELNKGKVVIVAGFQGVSRTKEITTLGRGGSDTTAVSLAAGLSASRCEIYTDVGGIFSADPNVVARARRYERLPLDLVFEMASKGAQVMHPRSIEVALKGRFPIYVGLAHPTDQTELGTFLVPDIGDTALPKVVAITSKSGLKAVHVDSMQANAVIDEFRQDPLLMHDMSFNPETGLIVLVDPSESAKFLARHSADVQSAAIATVSVIGPDLQQNTRISAMILNTLSEKSINPVGLTSHTQSITVWLSDPSAVSEALKALHETLIERT